MLVAILVALLLGFAGTASGADSAVLITPADGAQQVDGTARFVWTKVPGARYQLLIGTTPGAGDVFASRVRKGRKMTVRVALPGDVLLHARLWTFVGESATFTDSSFTVARVRARWLHPTDGQGDVNVSLPFSWAPVVGATRYRVQIGTTPGGWDLFRQSVGAETSVRVPRLPEGQTLYARVHAWVGWRHSHSDVSFVAVRPSAEFVYPTDSMGDVDTTREFEWTPVPGVQAYYLYVGTQPGRNDLVDTGEIQTTKLRVYDLPTNVALFARIYIKLDGYWTNRAIQFMVSNSPPVRAEWLQPNAGSSTLALPGAFRWTLVPEAELYYLWVGTAPATSNILNTGQLSPLQSEYRIAVLTPGVEMYARLWTVVAGVWRYRDLAFTAGEPVGSWVDPLDGELDVDPDAPLTWTTDERVEEFRLEAGTARGSRDLIDAAGLTEASYLLPPVAPGTTVHARLWTRIEGRWFFDDAVFGISPSDHVEAASFIQPPPDATDVDTALPFEWEPVEIALGYRLRIGTSEGASDVYDSGDVRATRHFVPALPLGVPLFARLETVFADRSLEDSIEFTATANGDRMAAATAAALWAVHLVRDMATAGNVPFPGTPLADSVHQAVGTGITCANYADTLVRMLDDVELPGTYHRRDVCFSPPPSLDCHSPVEADVSDTGDWLLLDPTFDTAARRAGTGVPAGIDVVSAATRASTFGDIEYLALGPDTGAYLAAYYLDYPLLFLNPRPPLGESGPETPTVSPVPYLQPAPLPISGPLDLYVVECGAGTTTATLLVDGVEREIACVGPYGVSSAFGASSLSAAHDEPEHGVHRLRRWVF